MKAFYVILAVLGFVLPLSQLFRGIELSTVLTQPFVNPVSTMFTFDLLVSCLVFFAYVISQRQRIRHVWIYIAMTLLVGLSFALPMFLLARERARVA